MIIVLLMLPTDSYVTRDIDVRNQIWSKFSRMFLRVQQKTEKQIYSNKEQTKRITQNETIKKEVTISLAGLWKIPKFLFNCSHHHGSLLVCLFLCLTCSFPSSFITNIDSSSES